jgi:hypothetical protein
VFYSNLKYVNFKDCGTKNINEVSLYAQILKWKLKKLKMYKWELGSVVSPILSVSLE